MNRSEYGPSVFCTFNEWVTGTHRPAGSRDPWFCMDCGSTTHEPVDGNH